MRVLFEFSGLCVIHLDGTPVDDPDGQQAVALRQAKRGAVYMPPVPRHRPTLYVPTACISGFGAEDEKGEAKDGSSLSDDAQEAFGWRTITVPGGDYLTAIDLAATSVEVTQAGQSVVGAITYLTGSKGDARKEGALPRSADQWRPLCLTLDAGEFFAAPAWQHASAGFLLPGGRLECLEPSEEVDRSAVWEVLHEVKGKLQTKYKQVLSDRMGLRHEPSTGTMRFSLVKSREKKDPLRAFATVTPFPGDARREVRIAVSCHCCLVQGQFIEELDPLGALFGQVVERGAIRDPGNALTGNHPNCPALYFRSA